MSAAFQYLSETLTLIKDPAGTPLYFHFAEGAVIKPVQKRFDIMHNGTKVGTRLSDVYYEITGKLVGEVENLGTLFPNLSAGLGTRLIGNTDTPWRAITPSGRQWQFHRAAITKRPGIKAQTGDTPFTEVTVTAVYSPTQSGVLTYTSGETHPGYSSFSASSILTLAPTISFGSAPFDNMFPDVGAEFDFGWELKPILSGNVVIDWIITGQTHTAKLTPQTNATWAEWQTKFGNDLAMGAALPVADIIASYTGFYVKLYNAEAELDQFNFNTKDNNIGTLTATAMQRYSAGAAVALSYVGTSAPA